ncbi:MAG TPA: hypothetical protein VGH87_24115 [Polyangiaceae bacterium]|jgi:hypothetical protein|nr:hypothetical protein [Polyangiaceae bacterium]
MNPRISKLEALLSRIHTNAAQPRVSGVAAAPPADERHDVEPGTMPSAKNDLELAATQEMTSVEEHTSREVEVPLESRARLVAAQPAEEDVEEIEADEVVELDDRHIVSEPPAPVAPLTMNPPSSAETRDALDVGAAQAAAKAQQEDDAPPPSSRRPIAEPAETPQEAQIQVQVPHPPHTPPPESGKQVAQDALSFDDDFTGVREAAKPATPPAPEPSIQLQSMRSPPVQSPSAPDEMEVDLAGTSPPPGPLPEMRSPRIESAEAMPAQSGPMTAEVSRPTRPVAAAQVAEMIGTVKPASPKTFGELLDAALSL